MNEQERKELAMKLAIRLMVTLETLDDRGFATVAELKHDLGEEMKKNAQLEEMVKASISKTKHIELLGAEQSKVLQAAWDHKQQMNEHNKRIEELKAELETTKNELEVKDDKFRASATDILNRFMKTEYWYQRMLDEYVSGCVAYRRECISNGINVSKLEPVGFDPNEPDPPPPTNEKDLDLEKLEDETRRIRAKRALKEAKEACELQLLGVTQEDDEA